MFIPGFDCDSKFPAIVMVLLHVSNQRDTMPPLFFLSEFKSQCFYLPGDIGEYCEALDRQRTKRKTIKTLHRYLSLRKLENCYA